MKVQKITLNDNSYDNKRRTDRTLSKCAPPALLSIDAEWDWPCASNTPQYPYAVQALCLIIVKLSVSGRQIGKDLNP
jgi:hypothetical protein